MQAMAGVPGLLFIYTDVVQIGNCTGIMQFCNAFIYLRWDFSLSLQLENSTATVRAVSEDFLNLKQNSANNSSQSSYHHAELWDKKQWHL